MVRTRPAHGVKNVCLRILTEKESQISDGECFHAEMLRQSHRSLGTILYDLNYDLAL